MVVLFAILTAMAWAYTQVFTGRAAMLHMGAFTATIMTANVAMIIIPNQKIVVADLKAGRVPDAKYGKIAKQRSLHNNYLTLPVIFFMLSSHYPLAFATQWNWLIASLIFLEGVVIRHWFNTRHARKGNPHWTWARGGRDLPRHRLAARRRPSSATRARRWPSPIGAGVSRQRRTSPPSAQTCHGPLLDVPHAPSRAMRASTRRPRTSASTAMRRSPTTPQRDRHPGRLFATPCRRAMSPR